MALADDIARDVASRYAGGDGPEVEPQEDASLTAAGEAMAAVVRGDRAAFRAAMLRMLEPADLAEDYEPELAKSPVEDDFDPDVLLGPE